MQQPQETHKIVAIHESCYGHYCECSCGEEHPIDWAENVTPIADIKIKNCKKCKKSFCCDMCRILGGLHE